MLIVKSILLYRNPMNKAFWDRTVTLCLSLMSQNSLLPLIQKLSEIWLSFPHNCFYILILNACILCVYFKCYTLFHILTIIILYILFICVFLSLIWVVSLGGIIIRQLYFLQILFFIIYPYEFDWVQTFHCKKLILYPH